MEPVIRKLPVPLTDEKKARLAETLAAEEQTLQEAREHKKNATAAINRRISGIEETIAELSNTINEGTEKVEVVCEWRVDLEADRKHLIRLDTDVEIEWAGLTEEDRQVGLFETPAEVDEAKLSEAVKPDAEMGSFMNKRLSRKKETVN